MEKTWEEFLAAQVFIVNLNGEPERLAQTVERVLEAGFKNLKRAEAINGHRDREKAAALWKVHGIVADQREYEPHTQGCLLSHLGIWKYIIDAKLPNAIVFEDDVLFHKDWDLLARQYYRGTPEDADMIYMGHHCGNAIEHLHIARVPAFCTNAYFVTLEGARKLYRMIVEYPYPQGVAIDVMLYQLQRMILDKQTVDSGDLVWYCWNTAMFPDEEALEKITLDSQHKDKGLVFQEYMKRNRALSTSDQE